MQLHREDAENNENSAYLINDSYELVAFLQW